MGSKHPIQRYINSTSLTDIQLESLDIQKKMSQQKAIKASLAVGVSITFAYSEEWDEKKYIVVSIKESITGSGEDSEGNDIEIFIAKIEAKAIFSVNFECKQKDVDSDCSEHDIQQVFIKQVHPVVASYARQHLNAMGLAGLPIPFSLPERKKEDV